MHKSSTSADIIDAEPLVLLIYMYIRNICPEFHSIQPKSYARCSKLEQRTYNECVEQIADLQNLKTLRGLLTYLLQRQKTYIFQIQLYVKLKPKKVP